MRELKVWIEIEGRRQLVGRIMGDRDDASFVYDESYLSLKGIRPISISLPLQEQPFSPEQTRAYFEGLLPEGFSRRAVSDWMKTDEDDYISILECLGRECIGAIMITGDDTPAGEDGYEQLELSRIRELASEGATVSTQILMETHLSLAGATGKVGLYYDDEKCEWFLPHGANPSTHIVKQSHVRLKNIVTNEQLCMMTAHELGIDVPESFVLNLKDYRDEEVLFVTKRYDRMMPAHFSGKRPIPYRLHQEDFSQALGIAASAKYETIRNNYLSKMFRLIRAYSSNPLEDSIKLWDRTVFYYLIGNADGHIKNFSLLYDADLRGLRLAPAYDILCTRVYGGSNEMSFFIGEENHLDRISRSDFERAASEAGIGRRIALQRLDELTEGFADALDRATEKLSSMGVPHVEELKEKIKR